MPNIYPLEFRQQMVELVRVGRSPEDLAKKFELSAQSICTFGPALSDVAVEQVTLPE